MESNLSNNNEIKRLTDKIISTTFFYKHQDLNKLKKRTMIDLFFLYGKTISLIIGYLYATTDVSVLDRKDAYLLYNKAFQEYFNENNKDCFESEESRIIAFIRYGLMYTRAFNVNLTTSDRFKEMFERLYLAESNIPPENFLSRRRLEELTTFNDMFEMGYKFGESISEAENDIKKLAKAFEHSCRNR